MSKDCLRRSLGTPVYKEKGPTGESGKELPQIEEARRICVTKSKKREL